MALDFTTDPGGMFPRIGRILHVAYLLTPYETSLPAAFKDIFDQYLATLEDVGGAVEVAENQLTRIASGVMSFATGAAAATVQQMVLADQPSQAQTLQGALTEVIRQMVVQTKTVESNVIAITPTPLTGFTGNGVLVTSTKRGDGLVQENSVAEELRLACTNDSYTGSATRGQETFGLVGSPATAGVWDYDYPTGSGANTQATAISAEVDANANTNLLTNGDFEGWTPSTPDAVTNALDNWTLEVGAWGTDIQQNTTNPNQGTYCLQFLPGATNTAIYQEFDDADAGTSASPDGLRSYAVNLWLRKLSGTISAGVLTVELVDDAGTVTADQQGVNNSFTVTLSSLTTSYVAYNATFRLNDTPPDVVRLRLRISTDLAGASFLVDDICYAPMTPFYTGGPGFCVFSGATPFVTPDSWQLVVTNDQGGASYLGTFQTGFDRLFNMKSMGLLLPSSGTPNISNGLISA